MISVGGGDGGDEKQGGKKANRFKPVVMTAGPFTLSPGETAKPVSYTHLTLPTKA